MLKLRSRGDMKNYKLDAKQLEKEISMTRRDKVNGIRDFPTTGQLVGTLAGTG